MKNFSLSLFVLILFSLIGNDAKSHQLFTTVTLVHAKIDCSPTSGDIATIQTALADYEDWGVSYVVGHTHAVTAETCDGYLAMSGIITLEIDEVLYSWNWERQGGGNVIVIWPV